MIWLQRTPLIELVIATGEQEYKDRVLELLDTALSNN